VKDVAEFFVIRGARRRGVGSCAAESLWSAFPGRWEVRVRRANSGGLAFWSRQLGGAADGGRPFPFRGLASRHVTTHQGGAGNQVRRPGSSRHGPRHGWGFLVKW
jgi:hypothetical protein